MFAAGVYKSNFGNKSLLVLEVYNALTNIAVAIFRVNIDGEG
jgi:hypothetical protein